MNPTLPKKLEGMIEELKEVDDLTDKYQLLIEMGREVADIPAEFKTDACLVRGCQSQVHIYSEYREGRVFFRGHADAMIVNGLLALLVDGLSGMTPGEFLGVSPDFIRETGVVQTLTPSRVNGFYNIHEKMKLEALKWAAQEDGKAPS